MAGRRYRVVAALVASTALLMAVPALAEHEGRESAHVGGVVTLGFYGHPFGFYPGWGWGWGWGVWSPGPWYFSNTWPGPGYSYSLQLAVPTDQVLVTVHVRPSKAQLTVDGKTMGKARDFDSVHQPLWLKPGKHVVEIARDGYQTLTLGLDLEGGHGYDLSYGLNKGTGVDGRSSEHVDVRSFTPTSS